MEKRLFCTLTLVMLALFLAAPSTSQAEIALMDGKLILSGFIKNTTYYRLNGADREFKQGHLSQMVTIHQITIPILTSQTFRHTLKRFTLSRKIRRARSVSSAVSGPGMKWPRAMMTAWPATCTQKIASNISFRKELTM